MKPDPDFGTAGPNLMLPEIQLWRAVLFRAVLDAQHGSQAMMRDVLRWIDTKDFERVLVWAGFELEQGRVAAKYLRNVCAERTAEAAKSGSRPLLEEPELEGSDAESELFDEALLALICIARDISQAKKASSRERPAVRRCAVPPASSVRPPCDDRGAARGCGVSGGGVTPPAHDFRLYSRPVPGPATRDPFAL